MSEFNHKYFSANVEFYLKEKGIPQYQLADAVNVTPAAFSNYKSGERTPDLETLIRIANYFEITPNDLLVPRTFIDNNIHAVAKSLNDDGLTDEERERYSEQTFTAIPAKEGEKIIDKKNATQDIRKIVIKHPMGKIAVYTSFVLGMILNFHPNPTVKLISMFALLFAGIFVGKNLNKHKKIDDFLNRTLNVMLIVMVICSIILLIKTL